MADVAVADLPAPPADVSAADLPAPPAPQPNAIERFGDTVVRGANRGLIEGALAIPELIADAPVALNNLDRRAHAAIFRQKPPTDSTLPSQLIQKGLDKAITPPKGKGGKVTELAASFLAPGGELGDLPKLFSLSPTELMRLHIDGVPVPESERIVQDGVSAGFRYPPSELPHAPVGRVVEGLTGKPRTEEEMSAHNLERVQHLVNAQLGLTPTTELTDDLFERLEQPAHDVYQQVADLGDIHPSPGYFADIQKAGERGAQAEADFPEAVHPSVLAERGKYMRTQFTGRGALERIKALRADGRANLASRDPEKMALGTTQLDISKALEKELGVQADRKAAAGQAPADLMKQFQNARTQLARIHAVQDAMVGGKVSARSLAKQYEDGAQLDGNLKLIAQNAIQHRNAFKDVQKTGEFGPYTMHDLYMMGFGLMGGGIESGVGAHHGVEGYGLAALFAARPLVRKVLGLKPMQKIMTRPISRRATRQYLKGHGPQAAAVAAMRAAAGEPDMGQDETGQ